MRDGLRRDVAQRTQRTERGEERERERAAPLLVTRLAQRLQCLHRADAVVLAAELEWSRRAEVRRDEQLVPQHAPDIHEDLLGRGFDAEEVIDDPLVRGKPAAQEEQALFGRALLAQLSAEPRAGAIVGERRLDEAAEQQRLLLLLHDEPPRQMRSTVGRVARRLQLFTKIAVRRRLHLAEQVAQVEEAIDAPQEHVELEEDFFATRDLQRADPALPFRQVRGAGALRIAHQVEEEILSSVALLHGRDCRATRWNPPLFARTAKVGRWKATAPSND